METSELIKEAKQGSAAAQKCLFDLWSHKMLLVCRRYVKNSEDAEELLLDGFCKFFKKLSSFNTAKKYIIFFFILYLTKGCLGNDGKII